MEDNITDIISKLNDIDSNTNNKTMLILQGITVFFIVMKPVLMFWIRAKYNVQEENVPLEHMGNRGNNEAV